MTEPSRGRGRPGVGPVIQVRLDPSLLAQVEAWADTHNLTRAEAIRRLLQTNIANQK